MSYEITEIISDEEIERVHGNANFGSMNEDKRAIVNQGVLKCAAGFYQGSTSTRIITDHGLIDNDYKLTSKGREYLWAALRSKISV